MTGRDALEVARVPPQAVESERAILAALLLDPGALERIEWLAEAAFYREQHRVIYRALRELAAEGKPCDGIVLCERLAVMDLLEKAGGREYVGSLVDTIANIAAVRRHAEIVQEASIRRQVIAHAVEIADRAYEPTEDATKLAEEAEDRFLSVLGANRGEEIAPFHIVVDDAMEWLAKPRQGLSTGYANIDRVWGAMQPGDLICIAGRPSMGKSSLAFNIAEHVARTTPVLVFTLEMTKRALAARAVRYHRSLLPENEAVTYLIGLKLWLDETPGIGAGYIRARAKRLKRAHGLGLIVVDYLQLMAGQGENRTQEVASVSRALKAIAKEYQVPVIAVSQLSRGVENRPDRRPVISDLRESGQIEQDADIIAFVYREEYYQPETPMQGIAEVLTRKHREGATGVSYMSFEAQYARFKNLDGPLPHAPTETKPRRYTAGRKTTDANVVDFKKNSGADPS